MPSSILTHLLIGLVLSLIQYLMAVPWLLLLLPISFRRWLRQPSAWGSALLAVGGTGVLLALVLHLVRSAGSLHLFGKVYGSVLQAQLTVDLLVGLLALLVFLWPKGGAVALAAFREGTRQGLFLFLLGLGLVLMVLLPFFPYNTFGEDHLMTKELGLEVIMLVAIVFGVLQAALSISEEIEGRTAITLMSKPVSRRQFLLGKFLGILASCLLLTGALAWSYGWMMDFKHWYDRVGWYDDDLTKRTVFPTDLDSWLQTWVPGDEGHVFLRGTMTWGQDAADGFPGLVLGFCASRSWWPPRSAWPHACLSWPISSSAPSSSCWAISVPSWCKVPRSAMRRAAERP